MIELNQPYSMKNLAKEMNISYGTFRNDRPKYEKHLSLFYSYKIDVVKSIITYTFTEQFSDFIPYREYNNFKRSKLIQDKIIQTLDTDARQTGSNISRIIFIGDEIQALDLQLSTLTNYTRIILKHLVEEGYYIRTDYRWCILDKVQNKYVLMTDEQIKELRSYFKSFQADEEEENIYSQMKEKFISTEEGNKKIGSLRAGAFTAGLERYCNLHGSRPMKVPVYERNALKPII